MNKSLRAEIKRQTVALLAEKFMGEGEDKIATPKLFADTYAPLLEEKAVIIACMIYRKRYSAFTRLCLALRAINLDPSKVKEFVCAAPFEDKVYVYPNLVGAKDHTKDYKQLTPFTDSDEELLSTLYNKFTSVKHYNKFSTVERKISFVRKRMTMDLTKFIAENYGGSGSTVRDLADRLSAELKPAQLKICETFKDLDLFFHGGAGTSCMHKGSSNASAWSLMYEQEQFHPGIFYLHYPYMRPVMILKGKTVRARTILHRSKTDGPWTHYGVIYAQTQPSKDLLIALLNEAGVSKAYDKKTFSCPKDSFDIGGIWSDLQKDYVAPTPYVDTISDGTQNIWLTFDIRSKTFTYHFGCNKPDRFAKKITLRTTAGFICAKTLFSNQYCYWCSTQLTDKKYITSDGVTFCNKDHAKAYGYVNAFQVDGTIVSVLEHTCVKDCWEDVWYTSVYSALNNKERKCYPAIKGPEDARIEIRFSAKGYTVLRDGELFIYHRDFFPSAANGQLHKWEVYTDTKTKGYALRIKESYLKEKDSASKGAPTIDW